MAPTPSVDDVEAQYDGSPVENGEFSKSDAQELIDRASDMADGIFSDHVLLTSELQGDEEGFVILLACHRWALALGEVQSESQSGGSVSYNTVTGEPTRGLTQTKYGREASEYLRSEPNVSIFHTR